MRLRARAAVRAERMDDVRGSAGDGADAEPSSEPAAHSLPHAILLPRSTSLLNAALSGCGSVMRGVLLRDRGELARSWSIAKAKPSSSERRFLQRARLECGVAGGMKLFHTFRSVIEQRVLALLGPAAAFFLAGAFFAGAFLLLTELSLLLASAGTPPTSTCLCCC